MSEKKRKPARNAFVFMKQAWKNCLKSYYECLALIEKHDLSRNALVSELKFSTQKRFDRYAKEASLHWGWNEIEEAISEIGAFETLGGLFNRDSTNKYWQEIEKRKKKPVTTDESASTQDDIPF